MCEWDVLRGDERIKKKNKKNENDFDSEQIFWVNEMDVSIFVSEN